MSHNLLFPKFKLHAILFLACLCASVKLNAQTSASGQRFWLGFIENISLLFNGDPAFGIVLYSEQNTTGIISVPQTGFEIPFTLNAGESQELFLPDAVWYTQGTELVDNKGILIEASTNITVQVYHYRIYFAESARILPETMLGDEYLVLAGEDFNSNSPSSLVIVATEDNTTVEITPSTLTQGLHAPGITFSVVLNEGQNYQIHAAADLSGTTINSDSGKKIAVFSGARYADIWCQGDDSHLWEQLPPTSMWRTAYPFIPYAGQGGDPVKIMAVTDGTQIRKNCQDWMMLDSGEYFETLMEEVSYIEANHPILLAHFNKSQNCNASALGGPSFSFVNPLNFQQYQSSFIVPFAEGLPSYFESNRLTIVCKSSDVANVLLDGNPLENYVEFGPAASFAYTQVDVAPGAHQLSSITPFWSHFYGFGQYDAYSHAGGFVEEIPFEWPITLAVQGSPTQEELCIEDVLTFSADTEFDLVAWEWDFGDGNSSILQNPSHTYLTEGNYLLQFTGTDAYNCQFTQSLMLVIEDCDSHIADESSSGDYYISQQQLNCKQCLALHQVRAFDSAGRLIANWQNISLPLDLPDACFLLHIVDEKNRAFTFKTARFYTK